MNTATLISRNGAEEKKQPPGVGGQIDNYFFLHRKLLTQNA